MCQGGVTDAVGSFLLDCELETYIASCGKRIEQAMAEWEATGCFAAHGKAAFWERAQRQAIARRSPAQIARMEKGRGLA